MKLLKEREVLHSTLNNDETLVKELEILRNNLNQSLKSNEQLAKEKRELLEKFQFDLNENQFLNEKNERKIQILLNENHKLKEEVDDIIREREEAANALRKSIQMTRNLTSKLNFEKERNQELEEKLRAEQHKLAMIIKAKEQVSNAMLDALHREKAIQSSITKSYPYEGGNGLIPSSYSGYVDRSPRYAGGVGGGAILSPSTGNHESPSKTPSARSPLEEKYASIPLSRPPSLHESPPGVVPNESNPPIHRSTIILPDSVEQFATVNATSQPDRDSSPRPSHDYFLNQLLSPSTPAPSVPPLPIPPSNPRVRDTLIDDLKRYCVSCSIPCPSSRHANYLVD